MISVKEAITSILDNSISLGTHHIHITKASDSYLSSNIYSSINLPLFRQSAMDGFAVCQYNGDSYKIIGEIQAGDSKDIVLKKGEGVRIFTGARVPKDADIVIMKEHVEESGDEILLQKKISQKTNIRIPGELIKEGDLALKKGTLLNSAALGFFSGLGVDKVTVSQKPRVAILVTGNELEKAGTPLTDGKIYDSNSIMLQMLLKKAGVTIVDCFNVEDTQAASTSIVKEVLEAYDFIIASGGISVGDYDLMRNAFHINGVDEKFYKINQRPGKPIYFGKKDNTLVFGLPGNPAACFINYQAYVLPALQLAMGKITDTLFKTATLEDAITNTTKRSLFLRAEVKGSSVKIFKNQNSAMLQSLVNANALVYISEKTTQIEKGEEVRYLEILQ
ncbi:molybdopterin molybdotransferase MoeA [Joostella sp.]|uniref:molybdopterin molybdotransferase MoeA n=1 Tax=Joostella sp. TaxID=2231138 RepID=UPI003A947E58